MKSTNTFGIQFIIRLPRNENNLQALVYARITVNGRTAEISLKQKVDPKAWDEAKGRAKGKSEAVIKLNNHLERIRTLIADGYHDLVRQRKPVTVDSVKSLFLGCDEEIMTLVKLMDYHSEHAAHRLAPGTMKNYKTTQKYIIKFIREKYYRNDMVLSELKYKFLLDFETYLNNYTPKDHQKPLNNNGIMKHIERLRKMINMAVLLDWLPKDPFANFKKHYEKVERYCLNAAEVKALAKKNLRLTT